MTLGGGFLKPGIRWQTLVTSDPLLVPEGTQSCPDFSCIIAESADLVTLFATSTAKILHRPSIYLFPRSCQVLFCPLAAQVLLPLSDKRNTVPLLQHHIHPCTGYSFLHSPSSPVLACDYRVKYVQIFHFLPRTLFSLA